ncbi:hypothetical protein FRC09_002375 [Ceratobasidium sp. 395]|nr:hypothetical protein FRC09_002375 [Ceratobasidium sp. 395]
MDDDCVCLDSTWWRNVLVWLFPSSPPPVTSVTIYLPHSGAVLLQELDPLPPSLGMDFDFWVLAAHDASERVKSLSRTVDAHGFIQDARAWIVNSYTDIKLFWEDGDGPILLEAGLELGKELFKEYYPQYRDKLSRFLMQPHVRKLWIT